MTLTPETIAQLSSMLEISPALLFAIQSCANPFDAAAIWLQATPA